MTDYLEQVVEGSVDALLEEQRRLAGMRRSAQPPLTAEEGGTTQVSKQASPELAGLEDAGDGVPEQEGLPLLARLRQVQAENRNAARAAAAEERSVAGLSRSRGGRERLPEGFAAGTGGTGLRTIPGPETDGTVWAEQMDRAFRRDSRRYDNGFFLY